MGTDKRERQKQSRQAKIEALREQEKRSAARRRTGLIAALIAAFVIFAIVYSVATSDDGDSDVAVDDATTDDATDDAGDTSDATTTSVAPPSSTSSTVPEVVAGSEPCPAADGSSERTLDFGGPFENCLEDGVDYQARFVTSEGEVLVDLREDEMPNTVNNFVALARYHYYDDTLLFRTDPSIDIIQGGSPHTQDPSDPGPGYTIPDMGGEFRYDENGSYIGPFDYLPGQLIMARSFGEDSSGAQFFFSSGPLVSLLDGQGTYLLFGDVTEGLDVLEAIMALHEDDPDSSLGGGPSRDVTVERVEIIEA